MAENNNPPINLTNSEFQHVYQYPATKGCLTFFLFPFLILFIAGIFAGGTYGLLEVLAPDFNSVPVVIAVAAVCLVVGVIILINNSRTSITHIVVNTKGIDFLQKNGKLIHYSFDRFVNLKVTRIYRNGQYSGTAHSLIFLNEKGKQFDVALGSLDKDLISALYEDIKQMKSNGCFAQGAPIPTSPDNQNSSNLITGFSGTAPVASSPYEHRSKAPNATEEFPYGISIIDGKYYDYPGRELQAKYKANNRIWRYSLLAMLLGGILSIMLLIAFPEYQEVMIIPAVILFFACFFTFIIRLALGLSAKKLVDNALIRISFFSNCLVAESLYETRTLNIPDISQILIPNPNNNIVYDIRYLTVMCGTKREKIALGKMNSHKKLEIFANYNEFYRDVYTWCAQHNIPCIDDIST